MRSSLLRSPFEDMSGILINNLSANTLVFDTVTPENIEACDILKWDDEFVYVIHVKKGFDTSMRDLAAQVSITAKRIRNDRKTDYDYLEVCSAKRCRDEPALI